MEIGFKTDFHLLNLKLTNICLKGKIETRSNRLSKVFGPRVSNWFGIKRLQSFISSLPEKEPLKFPLLPIQSPPDEGWFWEELSDLFVNTVRGGKNYREVLYQKKMLKIDCTTEKKRFKAENFSTNKALLSRKSLHWM